MGTTDAAARVLGKNRQYPRRRAGDADRRYKASKWTPPKGRDSCLDLYIAEVTRDIINSVRRTDTTNMTRKEEDALKKLMQDDEPVIRPADKG